MSIIQSIQIKGLRNLVDLSFCPVPGINIVYGPNGSGKTSVLEAIYLMAFGRSFRHRHSAPLIQDGAEEASVVMRVINGEDEHVMGWQKSVDGKSRMRMDQADVKQLAQMVRKMPLQLIDTDSHRHFAAGAKSRRAFMDWGLFHVKQSFHQHWRLYQQALAQRNAALKQKRSVAEWDRPCVEHAASMDALRQEYLKDFEPVFNRYLQALHLDNFGLHLRYTRGWSQDCTLDEIYIEQLGTDRAFGYTHSGPHRADLVVLADEIVAHHRLSQGQQKVLAYALRLAQAELLHRDQQKLCVFLIDDLPAELDEERRYWVMSTLLKQGWQSFITGVLARDMTHWDIGDAVIQTNQLDGGSWCKSELHQPLS